MLKETKLKIFILFTFLFFLLEIISGYYAGSVALVADSFHMLSDVVALFVALYASKLAKNRNAGVEFSFGLQRAEVVGALINGIALLSLSFTLIVESLQRFFVPQNIESPWLVLYVGSAGLGINLIGLFLFHDHHGHHGHSTTDPSRGSPTADVHVLIESPQDLIADIENPIQLGERVIRVANLMHERNNTIEDLYTQPSSSSSKHHHDHHAHMDGKHGHSNSAGESSEGKHRHRHSNDTVEHDDNTHGDHHHASGGHDHHHHHDLNMHGVFLHVLGDLLASFGVISSALVIIFVNGSWTIYMDPVMSLFITAIIVFATIPLVQSACYILLQRTPSSVSVENLRQDILQIPGVLGVHELHVWQLSEAQTVASVHVVVPKPDGSSNVNGLMEERYMQLASLIKIKLHSHGVHSTTVQPEFMDAIEENQDSERTCFLRCTSKACETKVCCPTD